MQNDNHITPDRPFTVSNPRRVLTVDDWPIGRQLKGKCIFEVEVNPKLGERLVRTTQNKYGQWCKPKKSVYSDRVMIVDGSDGKTHFICSSRNFFTVAVMSCDMKHGDYASHPEDNDYADLVDMLSVNEVTA